MHNKMSDRGWTFTLALGKSRSVRILLGLSCFAILSYFLRKTFYKPGPLQEGESKFAEKLPLHLRDVSALYVIPGGGSGAGTNNVDKHYPEWTRRRVKAAFEHHRKEGNKTPLFVALSAGSLNTPNTAHEDGRIKFECQHMIEHLADLGVPLSSVIGDFMSWDTVTNALFLRMVINGVRVAQKKNLRSKKLPIEVFISDFHAERVQAAFEWVLGLRPSLLPDVVLTINKVSSEGIEWPDAEAFSSRVEHEKKGVQQIKDNAKIIQTATELDAFVTLGPHKGIFNYLHHQLPAKTGSGW
jgi:hypothetical protein